MAILGPLPTEGIEPTRPCGHWILSPARLPIPPRRLPVKRELVIPLEGNASANDPPSRLEEQPTDLRRQPGDTRVETLDFSRVPRPRVTPIPDLFDGPRSVFSYQRVVVAGQSV